MSTTGEFVYDYDHYVCHITEDKNIPSIIESGLLPLNGDRCQFAMDDRIGVFFLDGVYNIQAWAEYLYKGYELDRLKLLRFNIKNRIWHIDSSNKDALGFYLSDMVTSDEIEFLTIKDLMNQTIPLTSIFELKYLEYIDYLFDNIECNKEVKINNKKLIWKPLEEYSKDMF